MTRHADSPPSRRRAPGQLAVAVMGTVVSLDIRGERVAEVGDEVLAAGAALLAGIDEDFSPFREDSWISRLHRHEIDESELPDRVRDVLSLCDGAAQQTAGWFSPHWRGSDTPDPTGLVKGWAADRVSDLFLARGFPDHCVNAAGDIVLSGSPAPELRWRVGIADPRSAGSLLGFADGTSGRGDPSFGGPGLRWAVATSGPVERGPHVLDPFTGIPAAGLLSASVLGLTGAETDAQATALIASAGQADLVRRLEHLGSAVVTVDADGRVSDPRGYLHPLPFPAPDSR